MKHLVIYAHPNSQSFCHAILESATEELKIKNNKVVVRDLYQINFDPVLKSQDFINLAAEKTSPDVKTEQDYIKWADVITVIYPIWWNNMPAILKGYIDRVFSSGFAYNFCKDGSVEKLLSDKKIMIFTTQGASEADYKDMIENMKKILDFEVFPFCGIEILGHKFFPSVPNVDDATRKGYLEEVKSIISKL
jgi:NAD(P)H dehydrogenase (quinone)